VFQDLKYIVDGPIVVMFLFGKGRRVEKKKERGRKIDKQCDHEPELLGVIDEHDLRVLYLLIQEQNAINDQQDSLHGGR